VANSQHSIQLADVLRRGSRIDTRQAPAGRSADSALTHGLMLTIRDQERKIHELQRQAGVALMTSAGVAERLGVSPNSVRRWTDAGKLACVILPGGERGYTLEDIDALLASCERREVTP
jgi:Helix-turn-helix domain